MALWTPSGITTALWLDASDATTITDISGGCDAWADKSGNGFDVSVYDASYRPAIVASAQNGLSILRFDGSNDVMRRLTSMAGLLQNASGAAIFVVHKYSASPTSVETVLAVSTPTVTEARAQIDGGRTSGKWSVTGRRLDADSFQERPSATSIDTAHHIVAGLYDYAGASAAVYLDGTEDASGAFQTAGSTSNTASARLTIGAGLNTTSAYFGGDLAEILALNYLPDTADRQIIEGYLAHKWGLVDNLPSDHPYKSGAPGLEDPAVIEGDLAFPVLQVSGGMATEGDILLPLLQIYGDFATEGSITLPLLTISGRMRDVINGEIRIHGLQFGGDIGVSSRIDSDITLPLLTVSGDMQADGEIRLHLLSIGGFMQQQGIVSGEITMHRLDVSGSMAVTTWMAGTIGIPALAISGAIGVVAPDLSGDIHVPLLAIAGGISTTSSNDFGTETDRVLRYASSRRHI
jgi:cytoskeletal protein CcmA (bactofilin family)